MIESITAKRGFKSQEFFATENVLRLDPAGNQDATKNAGFSKNYFFCSLGFYKSTI